MNVEYWKAFRPKMYGTEVRRGCRIVLKYRGDIERRCVVLTDPKDGRVTVEILPQDRACDDPTGVSEWALNKYTKYEVWAPPLIPILEEIERATKMSSFIRKRFYEEGRKLHWPEPKLFTASETLASVRENSCYALVD